jgi:subfamily B ATP-binding cassette protein MsbA
MTSNRLLYRLLKKSWTWIALSIVLGFSGAIFNGIGITLIIPLILTFLGINFGGADNLPPVFSSISATLENYPENYRILFLLACVVISIILKNLVGYANAITAGALTRRFTSSLRKDAFQLLLDVDLHYFSQRKLGEIINFVNAEISRVASAIRMIITITIASITILVFLAILVSLSWQLTLCSFAIVGFIAFINQYFIQFARAISKELSAASSQYSSRAIELLSGIKLVKSVANESAELHTISQLIHSREKAEFKSQLAFSAIAPMNETISIFAVILLVFAGRQIYSSDVTAYASVLITYLFVLTRMLPVVGQLNGARNKFAGFSASVDIVDDFLNRQNKPIMTSGHQEFSGLQNAIEFKNLWFRYPASRDWSLMDINLSIKKGETLALVGASGAGKSTLADLLARFYDPDKGVIEIDGVNLKDLDVRKYRQKIGIVGQETFLFNATIRENIQYGCPSATDHDIVQAARRANALDFIQGLPEGFETLIGDRGTRLSGGQRQRLAIARALLQNPEILILDEATSALDTISEKLVQQALEELSQERTALVIAHRLSTVQKATQIVVLDQGRVVEVGDHESLLKEQGYYAKLYSMQFARQHDAELAKDLSYDTKFQEISYGIRSELGNLLGTISLMQEDLPEDPLEFNDLDDHEVLKDIARHSAFKILKTLKNFEHRAGWG